jgi:tetratricopeptide (TPR) repeat protein
MMKNIVLFVLAVIAPLFLFAQDAAEKINQANEAMKAEDYAKAYELYDEAMNNLGDVQVDQTINYNIGFAAYKAKNDEGALKYFDKAIEARTNVSKCYEYKALVYNRQDNYAKAVENFEKAIETSEGESNDLVFSAAIAAYRGNMLDKAIELFSQSADNNYRAETALYYKAITLKKQGNDAAYKATLEEGINKFPNDDKISSALANLYVSEGNELYKKGVSILNTANEKISAGSLKTTDDAYIAEMKKAKVEFKAAVEILEKAKTLDPSNKNAQALLDACSAVL